MSPQTWMISLSAPLERGSSKPSQLKHPQDGAAAFGVVRRAFHFHRTHVCLCKAGPLSALWGPLSYNASRSRATKKGQSRFTESSRGAELPAYSASTIFALTRLWESRQFARSRTTCRGVWRPVQGPLSWALCPPAACLSSFNR